MEAGLFNITSATTTTLIDFDTYGGNVNSIRISNNGDVLVTISLYLHDGTTANDTYFVNSLDISAKASLLLNEGMSFDNSVLALKIVTEGTGPDISIIIK